MLLIVNADDLGASEAINNKIFDLMEYGLVTSSTIMVNGPAFDHAVQHIRRFPQCSFGVHLNLTVFRPLITSKAIEPILDDEGNLSIKYFYAHLSTDLLKALQEELFAQVQKAFNAGIPVSHFDSHHHIHTKPRLFFAIKGLQRHFGIRKVRTTINLLPHGNRPSLLSLVKKRLFVLALRRIWWARSTDCLGDLLDYYQLLEAGSIQRYRSIELMVHPGAESECYEKEIEILQSKEWKRLILDHAKLISFHSI
jgi:chitin disaccharide deacetylase